MDCCPEADDNRANATRMTEKVELSFLFIVFAGYLGSICITAR